MQEEINNTMIGAMKAEARGEEIDRLKIII
jgi:hypothetical protein